MTHELATSAGVSTARVALIAARGLLPIEVAHQLRKHSQQHHVFGIKGLANKEDYRSSPFTEICLGRANPIFKTIGKERLTHICLAGSIARPRLSDLRLDFNGLKIARRVLLDRDGDDAILRRLTAAITAMTDTLILAPSQLIPHWIINNCGSLTRKSPLPAHNDDIAYGRQVLKALAPYDIGQALVVDQGRVLAVEAAAGTQAMLEDITRHSSHKKKQRGVLVKAHKPGQSKDVDLPSIGPDTIAQAVAAGLAGIAIESKHSLVLAIDKVIEEADSHGLFLEAMAELN